MAENVGAALRSGCGLDREGRRMIWVRLEKYLEMSGETRDTVMHKRRSGIWAEGREWKTAGDGRIWINTEAVDQWVQTSSPSEKASKSGTARVERRSASASSSRAASAARP
ncbi:hypothetical protein CBM2592_A90094 [Cupriavidus taiwanensis]|nr:hypothetical protein CBM2592_A90094 [Cupriavidus taiwanensis]SOY90700.1 hypothetical protein CBM2591_A90093 [Cupriavidus taiwanensis]SOZ63506.1 hypothetical protein CBM2617_A70070 [Cupriavidus taiwanensis]SOZ82509.1 hypothetical protein CBM2618_A80070 [Cupriavidus taiwanensis]SOZ84391.1 hypothetical protein CBM2622_A80070 [Cupriavidus taiwanensis]